VYQTSSPSHESVPRSSSQFQKLWWPLLYDMPYPQFSKFRPKSIRSSALWRHLDGKAACIFENGTVVEKRKPLSWEKVLYKFKPTAVNELEVLKNAKQCFFMPTSSEKAKNCRTMTYIPSTILLCQTTLKKAKFLEFGLKNANLATLPVTTNFSSQREVQHGSTNLIAPAQQSD